MKYTVWFIPNIWMVDMDNQYGWQLLYMENKPDNTHDNDVIDIELV